MRFVYLFSYLLKKVVIKILDKINDWSCKNNVIFGDNTFFKNTASIDNISCSIKKIRIGKNTIVRGKLLIAAYGGDIEIGDNVYIGKNSNIWSGEKIVIGDDVLISHDVNIIDTNSHEIDYIERSLSFKKMLLDGHSKEKGSIETGQIIIENNVWISFGVSILKNVRIGEGAIIAAGAIVTKDVKPFTIIAGNPAIVVKELKR